MLAETFETPGTGEEALLQQALAYLPPPPAAVLFWSPSHPQLQENLQSLGYQVCVGATTELSAAERPPSLGMTDPAANTSQVAAVWLADLTPQVNALACLQAAMAVMAKGGRVVLSFAPGQTARLPVRLPPRLPDWQEYWCTIAARLGLELFERREGLQCLVRAAQEPRWQIRLAMPQDMPQIQSLFKAVFCHELSEAAWEWKYAHGRGNAILAYQHGELVAHYGAIYRDIFLQGERTWALQVVDVMVHPAHRGVMTKQGAFFLMTATWDELYGPLAFGFPTVRSMQLGQRLGIYADAGAIVELRWPAASKRPRLGRHLAPVDPHNPVHREKIEAIWRNMRSDLQHRVVGERGPDWLIHRFMEIPQRRYEVLAVAHRLGGAWDGVIVWRESENRIEILDLIAPLESIPRLIDQARRVCALRGCKEVYLWIAEASAGLIVAKGVQRHATDMRIPTDCWTGATNAARLIDHWWLLGGDSDFR